MAFGTSDSKDMLLEHHEDNDGSCVPLDNDQCVITLFNNYEKIENFAKSRVREPRNVK